MTRTRLSVIWIAFAVIVAIPLVAAAMSPLLAWRSPIYIAAGFAGIVAMVLLLAQPLLIGGYLTFERTRLGQRAHRWIGRLLVLAVLVHVAGLWITSPPDVIDALLFVSPTPFSAWGVVAMWAVFAAALLATLRRRWRLPPKLWRLGHTALALVTVIGSVVHAVLIDGTMEPVSKALLCILAVLATLKVMADLRVWRVRAT